MVWWCDFVTLVSGEDEGESFMLVIRIGLELFGCLGVIYD